jgi:hypothetical protein
LEWLKKVVLNESPTNYGFNSETWTAPLIVKVVEKHLGYEKKITNNRYIDTLKNRMIEFWKMVSHYQKPNQFIVELCNLNYLV